ncbi:BLUF domain-containing protein [Salegentibacter sp. HM20]
MRYAISYVSTVSSSLYDEEIQEALHFSKNWNNDNSITGILLYSQGNFFQVLEGDQEKLKKLFQRIKDDERHYDIITIFEKEVEAQKFDEYDAGFISLDSRYDSRDFERYLTQIHKLNPQIQGSVKYILNKFAEGIN